jgi:hypothetical protein
MRISRSRRSAYSARSCFNRLLCAALPGGRAASRIPAARRIRNSCRWSARRERRTFGNGSFTFSRLHLAALRDVPGAIERVFHFAEQRQHFVARLEIELRLVNRMRFGSLMVLPVWMHSMISCARASPCACSANRWWPPAECASPATAIAPAASPLVLIQAVILNLRERNCSCRTCRRSRRPALGFLVAIGQQMVSLMSPRRQADIAIRPLECRASRSLSMRGL